MSSGSYPISKITITESQLLSNDVGQSIRVTAVGQPTKGGSLVWDTTAKTITYDIGSNASDTDTFTYAITDSLGSTSSATVTIKIVEAAITIKANDDVLHPRFCSSYPQPEPADVLLTNDIGVSLTLDSIGPAKYGRVQMTQDGGFMYYPPTCDIFNGNPDPNAFLIDSMPYTVKDVNGNKSTANATVQINKVKPKANLTMIYQKYVNESSVSLKPSEYTLKAGDLMVFSLVQSAYGPGFDTDALIRSGWTPVDEYVSLLAVGGIYKRIITDAESLTYATTDLQILDQQYAGYANGFLQVFHVDGGTFSDQPFGQATMMFPYLSPYRHEPTSGLDGQYGEYIVWAFDKDNGGNDTSITHDNSTIELGKRGKAKNSAIYTDGNYLVQNALELSIPVNIVSPIDPQDGATFFVAQYTVNTPT